MTPLCASETDADDYDGHVWHSEMSVRTFPQAELEGSVLSMVACGGTDTVPVEHELVGSY